MDLQNYLTLRCGLWESLCTWSILNHLSLFFLTITCCMFATKCNGQDIEYVSSKSDLRSIYVQWQPVFQSVNTTNNATSTALDYLVKYCEDYPWDYEPKHCRAVTTNRTDVTLRELRPSTKYLVQVEQRPNRTGRHMSAGTPTNVLSDSASFGQKIELDRDRAVSVETQKYAIRNVDCLKGRTNVTVETGDSFEGTISVQKAGSPQRLCSIKGNGAAQHTYHLVINHTECGAEFLDNGTIMNAIILIQEHSTLVLGTDQSFRISCNYQPAVIQIQTGMGMDSQHQITRIGVPNPADLARRISFADSNARKVAFLSALNNITSASKLPTLHPSPRSQSANQTSTWPDTSPALVYPTQAIIKPRVTIPSSQYDTPEKISQFYGDEPVAKAPKGHPVGSVLSPGRNGIPQPVMLAGHESAARAFPESIRTSRPMKDNALIAPGLITNDTFFPSKLSNSPAIVSQNSSEQLDAAKINSRPFGMGRMPTIQIIIIAVAGTLTALVLMSMIIWFIACRNKPHCVVFPRKRALRHVTDDERYA